MTEGLRVLQIVRNLDIGGAQEVVRTLAWNLQQMGHTAIVCTLKDGELRSDFEDQGIPVEVLRGRNGSVLSPIRFVRETKRMRSELAEIVARHHVNVVQTHLLRSVDFTVASLRWSTSIPLVFWTFHNVNFTVRREHLGRHAWLLWPKRLAYRFLYRGGSAKIDGLIAVSDEVKEAMVRDIGPIGHRVHVIPNGVDVDRFESMADRESVRDALDLNPASRLMIMVGTFKRQKGHRFLIEAVERLAPDHPELRVALVGDGELRPELEAQIARADLQGTVHLLGNRRDVPSLLAASDFFVLPSLWEGLPMALLEAMAAGLPCIATLVSGSRQVIESGVHGLLVEPGNVDDLYLAMRQMLADSDLATALGLAGRQRILDHFSSEAQARRHVDLFQGHLPAT